MAQEVTIHVNDNQFQSKLTSICQNRAGFVTLLTLHDSKHFLNALQSAFLTPGTSGKLKILSIFTSKTNLSKKKKSQNLSLLSHFQFFGLNNNSLA
jgi:hypothetical protein